jgi:hypothetical protein
MDARRSSPESRDNETSRYRFGSFVLFLLSSALAIRVFFRTIPDLHGAYLLVLSLICMYLFYAAAVQFMLTKQRLVVPTTMVSLFMASLFFFHIAPYWSMSHANYRNATFKIITPRGDYFGQEGKRAKLLKATIDYVLRETPADASMVVLPEGIGINALTSRRNPMRFYYFTPPGIGMQGEEKLIRTMAENRIDYILVVHRSTDEYGPSLFGVDYAVDLRRWIDGEYECVSEFGRGPFERDEFGTALYRRR